MSDQDSRYVVVSADGHVGLHIEKYREYCPKKYLPAFDEQVANVAKLRREDTGSIDFGKLVEEYTGNVAHPDLLEAQERIINIEGAWDPVARLRDMDADGIAAEVIFHGHENGEPMPLVGDGFLHPRTARVHKEHDAVGCRIYNRWLADFVAPSNGRQAGLAYIPIHDVDAAVKEVEWARNAGLRGINLPAPRTDLPPYYDQTLDPLYDVCAQLDMPLTTHGGGGQAFSTGGKLNNAVFYMEQPFSSRRGIWQLIFSGVFERFPRLKMVLTEIRGAMWVPEVVREMDGAYFDPMSPWLREMLPRLPSEYWTENFYVGASFMSHDEALMYPDWGTGSLMWGADYPHLEGTFPYTHLAMQDTFHDIKPAYVANMIGKNAIKAYSFDADLLESVAQSIGPTVDDLAHWSGEVPGPEYHGHAFRQHTRWPALSV